MKNSTVALDLALCYQRLGDVATAIAYLDEATAAASEPKRRMQLAQWRTVMVTGEDLPTESG